MRPIAVRVICLTAAVAILGTFSYANQQHSNASALGFTSKKPVLGAACKICPWGVLADVVKQALQPYGYDVQVCYNCSGADNPRIVAGAKIPESPDFMYTNYPMIPRYTIPPPPKAPVDFGVTSAQAVWNAYHGSGGYAKEGPRRNLRLFANIQSPSYFIVAVKAALGITDLSQVKQKHWPVRVIGTAGGASGAVLAYYGLTKESIEAGGGRLTSGRTVPGHASIPGPDEKNNFDIIVAGGTLGNAPEYNVWYEVSQKYDLTYLQLPDDLLDKLAKDFDMQRGVIPLGLLRGIDRPIRTVVTSGTAVYGRTETPDDFAYLVAKAMDEHKDLLQWSALTFSYNDRTVWKDRDVPLHPGAERYYRERGYIK